MNTPQNIQLIGNELAIAWDDGAESYIPAARLRAASPSADQRGERDLFGNLHGGSTRTDYPDVRVTAWEPVGNYALRFDFSDGHRTGIYSYDYLRDLSRHA
ncbi:MAG: DUF971 domain-containing protein [Opitutaceae bacterium]|nr:DUF971 domain-containing protein [Opitutaceae bacterium]